MFSIDNCKKKKKKKRKEKRQESIIKMGKTSSKTQLKFPYFDFFFLKKKKLLAIKDALIMSKYYIVDSSIVKTLLF